MNAIEREQLNELNAKRKETWNTFIAAKQAAKDFRESLKNKKKSKEENPVVEKAEKQKSKK